MHKKLIAACMALAAFAAFALPVSALATNEPDLTEESSRVPTGTTVVGTATNTELQTTAGSSLLNCTTSLRTGVLLQNAGGTVEIESTTNDATGTGVGLECTTSFGNSSVTYPTSLCIRSTPAMATDELRIGSTCTTFGNVKIVFDSTTVGECEMETTGPMLADYTTGGTQAQFTVRNTQAGSGLKKIKGGFLCPSSARLKMTFGLEKEDGTKLTIS